MAPADGRRSGFGRNSVQADYDGTPMVTDLMHDETALALASVLGERNEGFIQMSYIPDARRVRRRRPKLMPSSITRNWRWRQAGRFSTTRSRSTMRIRSASAVSCRWLESCAERGIRVYGQSATLEVGLRVHLQGLEPVGRYAGVARSHHRPDRRSPDEAVRPGAPPGTAQESQQTGLITNNYRDIYRARVQGAGAEEVREPDDWRNREDGEQASGRCDARYRVRRRPQHRILLRRRSTCGSTT